MKKNDWNAICAHAKVAEIDARSIRYDIEELLTKELNDDVKTALIDMLNTASEIEIASSKVGAIMSNDNKPIFEDDTVVDKIQKTFGNK